MMEIVVGVECKRLIELIHGRISSGRSRNKERSTLIGVCVWSGIYIQV